MKKFLAVLVVFTLIAGVAFADVSLGGSFGYAADVLKGDNNDAHDLASAQSSKAATLDLNFSGENYGGRVRLYGATTGPWWSGSPFAFAWWKPSDQFRFQIGHNPDGNFGAAQITGWGFLGSAQDYVAICNDSDDLGTDVRKQVRKAGFYPGFSGVGALMSIYPADGVEVNFALPFGKEHSDTDIGTATMKYPTWRALAYFHTNVGIKIGDIGKVNLSFKGDEGLMKNLPGEEKGPGDIYLSFFLTAVENLRVDVGLDYPLPYNNDSDLLVAPGLKIGLGATYSAGDFGVKFRAGMVLPQAIDGKVPDATVSGTGTVSGGDTQFAVNLLPYFNLLDGKLTAYLNTGLGIQSFKGQSDATIIDWYVNPYVRVPAGGLTFWAGFKLIGTGTKDKSTTAWSIPIGVSVGF